MALDLYTDLVEGMRKMPVQKPGRSKQDYCTPPSLLDAIKVGFGIKEFDWDLAASKDNRVCTGYYSEDDNSLIQSWKKGNGWNWCNPPYCVAPNVNILKEDLTWCSAENISQGDMLIAFTEYGNRTYCSSKVVHVNTIKQPSIRLYTTQGDITVSKDHLFLAKKNYSEELTYVKAENLINGMIMPFFGRPWSYDNSRDAGYISGFLDGEGHIAKTGAMGYSQLCGPVADHALEAIRNRGYAIKVETIEQRLNKKKLEHVIVTGGIYERLKLLGAIRPHRLLPKNKNIWVDKLISSKVSSSAVVLGTALLKPCSVVAITTSSKTLITDGFYSHNCDIGPWVEKAYHETMVNRAKTIVLVPASVGSNWWRDWVHEKCMVYFMNGRVTFVGMEDSYPKDTALLCYYPAHDTFRDNYNIWTFKQPKDPISPFNLDLPLTP